IHYQKEATSFGGGPCLPIFHCFEGFAFYIFDFVEFLLLYIKGTSFDLEKATAVHGTDFAGGLLLIRKYHSDRSKVFNFLEIRLLF
ncbi:MAG: hypothetical protein JXJ04_01555, partial [Spirochaetales bacterium]|nr:hypothetical protein [Spirochaetales bacterium]